MTTHPFHLVVASGLLVVRGKILLTQRGDRSDLPFHFELPGGKVDPGETDGQALVREFDEEVGLDVAVTTGMLFRVSYEPPVVRAPVEIRFYGVDLQSGGDSHVHLNLKDGNVAGAIWLDLERIERLRSFGVHLVPSIHDGLPTMIDYLRKNGG